MYQDREPPTAGVATDGRLARKSSRKLGKCQLSYDDVMAWKRFSHFGHLWIPLKKGHWCGAPMFLCCWT